MYKNSYLTVDSKKKRLTKSKTSPEFYINRKCKVQLLRSILYIRIFTIVYITE